MIKKLGSLLVLRVSLSLSGLVTYTYKTNKEANFSS